MGLKLPKEFNRALTAPELLVPGRKTPGFVKLRDIDGLLPRQAYLLGAGHYANLAGGDGITLVNSPGYNTDYVSTNGTNRP